MTTEELAKMANTIRQDIIKMLVEAGSGHSAGPLGMADVFTAMYFVVLKHDPKNPDWPERDRLILSNGHIVPVRYATMARAGYFPVQELMTLRKFGSRLQGHPERLRLPGLETTSGPLGSGLSQASGIAKAWQIDGIKNRRVYCLMSDGDRNNIQIDGPTEQVMPLEDLRAKWEAFGWHVMEIDGHNFTQIIDACNFARTIENKPVMILAHTIPGKGVDFMEYDFHWHGKPPNPEQAKEALRELRTLGGRIRSEHQ